MAGLGVDTRVFLVLLGVLVVYDLLIFVFGFSVQIPPLASSIETMFPTLLFLGVPPWDNGRGR